MTHSAEYESRNRYYLDTTGLWMLDALFDPDLQHLEFRQQEYLAFLVNAFANPDAKFFAVLPEGRLDKPLPAMFDVLKQKDAVEMVVLTSDKLVATEMEMESQFETFCCLIKNDREAMKKFVKFHTRPKMAEGFYGASGFERVPGVPEHVNTFLTLPRQNRLRELARDADALWVKQGFSIFQRGFTYWGHAAEHHATYLTHPVRWAATGLPRRTAAYTDWTVILGGIASIAIRQGKIKDAASLFEKLITLRNIQPEFVTKLSDMHDCVRHEPPGKYKEYLEKELHKEVLQIVNWINVDLTPDAEKALRSMVVTLVASLVGSVAYALVGASGAEVVKTLFSAGIGGVGGLGTSLLLLAYPTSVTNGFWVPRRFVDYNITKLIPQSCCKCGASDHAKSGSTECSVCKDLEKLTG